MPCSDLKQWHRFSTDFRHYPCSVAAQLCTNCAGSGSYSSLNQRQIREMPGNVFSTLQVGFVWRGQQKAATNQKVGSSNLSGPRHWELRPDSGLKVECYGSTKPEIGAVAASRRKIFPGKGDCSRNCSRSACRRPYQDESPPKRFVDSIGV